MPNKLFLFLLLIVVVLISSFSQILLKKSALIRHKNALREYINPLAILGYSLLFISIVCVSFIIKYVPLSYVPLAESTAYIFVPVLSYFFLREKISRKKIFGIVLIVIGICVVALF